LLIVKKLLRKKYFWGLLAFFLALTFRTWQEYKNVQSEPVNSWKNTVQADCAVVLTGGAGRVREGFDLLANQNIKKLIISGVYQNAQLREIMPTWTFYGGLREEDVVLERRSETTYGNAQQSLAIVEALKCRDVVLVTSRLHMYRSYRTFRSIFPPNIPIYKQAVVSVRLNSSLWDVLNEAFKSLFYSTWVYSD
jgi:uncharacterized SAM-binding protein YcdF (DUF218 family)